MSTNRRRRRRDHNRAPPITVDTIAAWRRWRQLEQASAAWVGRIQPKGREVMDNPHTEAAIEAYHQLRAALGITEPWLPDDFEAVEAAAKAETASKRRQEAATARPEAPEAA